MYISFANTLKILKDATTIKPNLAIYIGITQQTVLWT